MDGLEPAEALRTLAERAGVELTRRAPQEREREKRLLAAHEAAHFYFRQALRGTPAGRAAAEYLAARGIVAESIERFGLGYALDLRDGLLTYLQKKGYSDDEILAAGVVVTTERGLFDRFRDRLMVPIRDGRGRIVAFGGRAMRADQPGKYVNSPQTELFNKSAVLYGLDIAKAAIRRRSEAVIVEGYFDVIACHQAGLDGVVASMGTALTEDQYRILDDLKIERAIVAFDGDAAGKASAERRGRELARIVQRAEVRAGRRGSVATRTGLTVYVAVLPEGRDPDDLARSDPERLRAVLAEAQPVLTFLIERAKQRSDLEGPEGRRRFLSETLPLVADEPDQLRRELYLGTLSSLTGVREETLRERLAAASTEAGALPERASRAVRAASARWAGQGTAPAEGEGADQQRKQTPSIERYLMAQLVQFPEEAARLDLDPDELVDPDHRAILELFRAGERPGPRFPGDLAAVVAALGAQAPAPVEEEHAARAIEMAALKVREEHVRRQLGEKRSALARASASGGDVGGLAHEVARLGEELEHVMRAREPQTVLRETRNEEDQ